jgi:hydrogenase maturation factor
MLYILVGDYVLVFCIASVGDYVLVFYGVSVDDNVLGVLCFIGW